MSTYKTIIEYELDDIEERLTVIVNNNNSDKLIKVLTDLINNIVNDITEKIIKNVEHNTNLSQLIVSKFEDHKYDLTEHITDLSQLIISKFDNQKWDIFDCINENMYNETLIKHITNENDILKKKISDLNYIYTFKNHNLVNKINDLTNCNVELTKEITNLTLDFKKQLSDQFTEIEKLKPNSKYEIYWLFTVIFLIISLYLT